MEETKTVMAVSRSYRGIAIYQTAEGFEIVTADNQILPFISWTEACSFVDAWFAMQIVVVAS